MRSCPLLLLLLGNLIINKDNQSGLLFAGGLPFFDCCVSWFRMTCSHQMFCQYQNMEVYEPIKCYFSAYWKFCFPKSDHILPIYIYIKYNFFGALLPWNFLCLCSWLELFTILLSLFLCLNLRTFISQMFRLNTTLNPWDPQVFSDWVLRQLRLQIQTYFLGTVKIKKRKKRWNSSNCTEYREYSLSSSFRNFEGNLSRTFL